MNIKLVVFIIILVTLGALLFWTGGNFETKPEPQHQHEPGDETQPEQPTGTELPTVERVQITAQDTEGEEFGPVELTPDVFVDLTGTKYRVRMTEFYTHWNWNMVALNLSKEEQNPAVKVEVFEGDSLRYHGWGFRNLPFFRMGDKGEHGSPESGEGKLAFTLLSYEGVRFGVQ